MALLKESRHDEIKRRKERLSRDSLVSKAKKFFTKTFLSASPGSSFSASDCLISGLAVFLFKYPSLLSFEGAYGAPKANHNLRKLLKLKKLPSDTSVRYHLDSINPDKIKPIFKDIFNDLRRNADLNEYRRPDGSFLVSIDGTQTFSSKKVHCPSCLVKKHRNGSATYSHQIMTAVLISPSKKAVFPIDCEEISNTDGISKNDCELNATHRLLRRIRKNYPGTKFTITADGLSSNAPNISLMQELNFNFILVAKDGNHKYLAKKHLESMKNDNPDVYDQIDKSGMKHVAICQNSAKLNQSSETLINYLCYWTEDQDGHQEYYNTWVTNTELTKRTAFEVSKSGRTYWRIENETHNTLKNQGYNLEHNYGHGEKHLCSVFTHLTLLAFLIDQINMSCPKFSFLVEKLKTRVGAWKQIVITLFAAEITSFSSLYNSTVGRFNTS
ncbi:MAG: transposase [Halobacteriovoraceae bacterium]|nr:transposase [Halobacteriovoraceae bacterium]